MKNLLAFLMICLTLAGCSPAPHADPPAKEAVAEGPSSLSRSLAVTVRPPAIPIGPVQGNPAFPVSTPTPFFLKGWQTFSSSNLGVAIDYPPDWSVTEQADGAIFTSPQGAQILLQSTPVNNAGNGINNSNGQCTNLINSYGLTAEICFDTASKVYSAEFNIKSAGDSTQLLTLSTSNHEALETYKEMLNSLRLAQ